MRNIYLPEQFIFEASPENKAKAAAYWADRKARDIRRKEMHSAAQARINADPELKAQQEKLRAEVAAHRAANKSVVDTSGDW